MARIHIILQGFVDINLETNENVNTQIVLKNQFQINTGILDLDFDLLNISKSSAPDKIELPVPIEDIFENIGINLASIQLVHIQGSRLYGVEDDNSDWDLAVISTDVTGKEFRETNVDGNEFDIHLYSQEEFQNRLDDQEIRLLEIVSHPEKVIVIENKTFIIDIDNDKLINATKIASDDIWNRAKNKLDSGGDSYTALKEIWHSFRYLIFAEQILKDGIITDFSAANYLYESIINSKQTDFEFFELNFSTLRETLKLNLDTYKSDGGLELIEFTL